MEIEVWVEVVRPRKLAAVRRQVPVGSVASAWRPALDHVWSFLRTHPELRTEGHNIFLYHHPARGGDSMMVDFGVEVTQNFSAAGEVYETATPGGEAAIAVHRGGYDQLHGAHKAIHQWAKSHDRIFTGTSWEVYGDWSDDPSKLETMVVYLLA